MPGTVVTGRVGIEVIGLWSVGIAMSVTVVTGLVARDVGQYFFGIAMSVTGVVWGGVGRFCDSPINEMNAIEKKIISTCHTRMSVHMIDTIFFNTIFTLH